MSEQSPTCGTPAAPRPAEPSDVCRTSGPPAGGGRRMTGRAVVLLGLAGAGLAFYWITHRDIPLSRIGTLRPGMNAALIRVQGRALGNAQVAREDGRIGGLRFIVDDGSGQLPVTAAAAQAQTLAKWDRVPRAGDPVTVAGQLYIETGDRMALRLQRDAHLLLTRQARPARDVRRP